MFVLVHCNNFCVSCERVFEPALEGKPVAILSHNDSCVICRSEEAKVFGIKPGQPFLQIQALLSEHQIRTFSSNFALYCDFSHRLMSILSKNAAKIEAYSLGEAFFECEEMTSAQRILFGQELQAKIKQWIGLPASIGFGPTKTLAKIANGLAKETEAGVYDLAGQPHLDALLAKLNIDEIWGVDARLAFKLRQWGVYTALDLKRMSIAQAHKTINKLGVRLIYELNGISCLCLDDLFAAARDRARFTVQHTFSRSFDPFKANLPLQVSARFLQGCSANSLIQTLAVLNKRQGTRAIYFGAAGQAPFLKPKVIWQSPPYTTRWDSIKCVR